MATPVNPTDQMKHGKKDERAISTISWLSSALVLGLALASFWLSFDALRHLAIEKSEVPPHLAFLFPLIVDGAIIVFSLSALRASLRTEKSYFLTLLVCVATIGSILFNISHAGEELLGRIIAATPPVLLFLSFEALMHQTKSELERKRVVVSRQQLLDELASLKNKKDTLLSEFEKIKTETPTRTEKKQERNALIKLLAQKGASPKEISKAIGVSLRTIQRDLKALGFTETETPPTQN